MLHVESARLELSTLYYKDVCTYIFFQFSLLNFYFQFPTAGSEKNSFNHISPIPSGEKNCFHSTTVYLVIIHLYDFPSPLFFFFPFWRRRFFKNSSLNYTKCTSIETPINPGGDTVFNSRQTELLYVMGP